ncbi:hypothetical protein [Alkaliphilus crotonatoxidans]
MDQGKLNELMAAIKAGDFSKVEEIKNYISEEDYQKVLGLFNQYSGKSEAEIIQELQRLKHTVPNQQELVEKLKPFLNDEQKRKLQQVLQILEQD